ncbi:hypothetical protein YW3DRAFT_07390 [Streptomyces sp. MnatMP-M77]|nr:hypothetical protein YW3DRAFT_07390 [Streptomyces sp. MnatMP-M77]
MTGQPCPCAGLAGIFRGAAWVSRQAWGPRSEREQHGGVCPGRYALELASLIMAMTARRAGGAANMPTAAALETTPPHRDAFRQRGAARPATATPLRAGSAGFGEGVGAALAGEGARAVRERHGCIAGAASCAGRAAAGTEPRCEGVAAPQTVPVVVSVSGQVFGASAPRAERVQGPWGRHHHNTVCVPGPMTWPRSCHETAGFLVLTPSAADWNPQGRVQGGKVPGRPPWCAPAGHPTPAGRPPRAR